MIRFLLAILFGLSLASLAEACNCGRFGTQCVTHQRALRVVNGYGHQQRQVLHRQQQYHQQQLLVPSNAYHIENHYPSASLYGVYPQGNTVYSGLSVGSLSQSIGLPPEIALEAAKRLGDNAAASLKAAIELGSEGNNKLAEVAKAQLAVEHLRAFASMTAGGKQEITLKIDAAGGVNVEQSKPAEKPAEQPGNPPPEPTPQRRGSMIKAKCASCHGADKTQPGAGLFYDQGLELSYEEAMRPILLLRGRLKTPAPMESLMKSLTDEERAALIDEFESLAVKADE